MITNKHMNKISYSKYSATMNKVYRQK